MTVAGVVAQEGADVVFREGLAIGSVGKSSRSPVYTDAIEALIVNGRWEMPREGQAVQLPDGSKRTWEKVAINDEGWFEDDVLRNGYVFVRYIAEAETVVLLEAIGHSMVYVNGEPRAGDPYGYGFVRLPILLKEGENEFLFRCARGGLQAKLVPPEATLMINGDDETFPDLMAGERQQAVAALVVINATTESVDNAAIMAGDEGSDDVLTNLPMIPPMSIRKVPFRVDVFAPEDSTTMPIHVRLVRVEEGNRYDLDKDTVAFGVRRIGQSYKRTFTSRIDGSVQYYAVNPAQERNPDVPHALFLTLHGASVEGIGQANAYAPKGWGHLVAPTNRRPFGFDWEDWGRMDALEVLELAQAELGTDPRHTYLTGHSMGGHGTWHLGVTYPDRFAAIGPSAGWISFTTYSSAAVAENPSDVEKIMERATLPSNTLALASNYEQSGVYILHGDADNNVPVTEARTMREELEKFHKDMRYYEQPEAGHWWDVSEEPGADCVDWRPMFDFFARRANPENESVHHIKFVTASPGVSAQCNWVRVESQEEPFELSKVDILCDPLLRRFTGTTGNVSRLSFSIDHLVTADSLSVMLDGDTVMVSGLVEGERVWVEKGDGGWVAAKEPNGVIKTPERYGPFKEGFRNNVLFVYGTSGSTVENQWSFTKARYDAETFWYRGNGSVDVLPDTLFTADKYAGRNVILYGNAETNNAWNPLLGESTVTVKCGSVIIGGREIAGEDQAALFVQPRRDGPGMVGAIAPTGGPGMRLSNRFPYFVSGVAYPDCTVIGAEMLEEGSKGIRAAGFFGPDWRVKTGEFVFSGGSRRGRHVK